jgi:pheromone shutdown protein TraB
MPAKRVLPRRAVVLVDEVRRDQFTTTTIFECEAHSKEIVKEAMAARTRRMLRKLERATRAARSESGMRSA